MPGKLYDIPLSFVVLTGEPQSGKSIFPVLSTPNALDLSKPPQAVVMDHEGSMEPYVGALNFKWCDVRQGMADGVHRQTRKPDVNDAHWKRVLLEKADVNDSLSASLFRATVMALLAIEPGQYLVCSLDTFKPLQDGATDWLLLHPEAFGKSLAQYQKMKAAILIPDVRKILEHIITVECRSRFEMTVATYHQKNEWEGQGDAAHKTGQRVSEAWELADKLATLYVTLDRRPKAKGKQAPRVPSALVVWPYGKSRLMAVRGGKLLPVLPPRMPEFTPEALRAYMATPPDYDNLKPEERMPDDALTDDQKLLVQSQIAVNERATSENRLSALEMARQAAEAGRAAAMAAPVARPTQTGPATPAVPQPATITTQQATELLNVMRELFITGAEARTWLKEKCGTENPATFTETQAMGVLSNLYALKAAKQQAATVPPAPETPLPATPPAVPAANNGFCSQEQRGRIRDLTIQLFGDRAADEQTAFLGRHGLNAGPSMPFGVAATRIVELELKLGPPPADTTRAAGAPF